MEIAENCGSCYYAKSEPDDNKKRVCIIKKETVNAANRCGYYLKNNDFPAGKTG